MKTAFGMGLGLSCVFLSAATAAQAATVPYTTGLIRQFDASDVDGNGVADALASGQHVTTWADLSTGHHDATGGTGPTYLPGDAPSGLAALHFDGTDADPLLSSGDSLQTIFFVTRVDAAVHIIAGIVGFSGGDKGVRRSDSVPATNWRGQTTNPDDFTFNGDFRVNGVASEAASAGTWHIVSATASGQATWSNIALGGYFGGRGYTGDVGEVLIYSGALADADRQSVEGYLNQKWLQPAPEPTSLGALLVACGAGTLRRRRRA